MKANNHHQGLYRPEFERDNCGFGLIAHMDGEAGHGLVESAIQALSRLTHRGAVAADGKSGDGCGLLMKLPVEFLRVAAQEAGIELGPRFAVGMVFLNHDTAMAEQARRSLEEELARQNLTVAGWRAVPVDIRACGQRALETLRRIQHHRVTLNRKLHTGVSSLTEDQGAILASLKVSKPSESRQLKLL